jgi:hypothetical protein
VARLGVGPACVSAQHGRGWLTKPALAVRATGVAGWGPCGARTTGNSLSAAGILPRLYVQQQDVNITEQK